jgi:hypothetical protein
MASNVRSYTAGNFTLDIDGYNVGYLKKFSGGGMKADIVTNKLGPDNVEKKHVVKIVWEDFKFDVGVGMGVGCYEWMRAAFRKEFLTKQATLTAADFNHKATSEMQLIDCLITEITIPKMDGGSKDAAFFSISAKPERVRHVKAGGQDIRAKIGPAQKAFLCSNFRLEIGNLPCNRVKSVDSMVFKCSVVPDDVGIFRESTLHPAAVVCPNMKVTWSYADFEELNKAAHEWFVAGKHLEGDEMEGRLVFLDPNMKDEIAELTMHNIGWVSWKGEDLEGGSEKVKTCQAEFYYERAEFKIGRYDS